MFSRRTGRRLKPNGLGCVTLVGDDGSRTARSARSLLALCFPAVDVDQSEIRPIPGYDGYFVTRDGRIFSDRRYGREGVRFEMRQHRNCGYLCVTINRGEDHCVLRVHIAVALAYIGPKPFPLAIVRHRDGTRDNNVVGNLCWGTKKENAEDMVAHGRAGRARGERSWTAKTTEESVREMRRLAEVERVPTAEIARRFGLSRPQAGRIINRRSWKHVA